MTDKDEMKNKISMALKDPVLQQGFEIICKNLTELEKAYNETEELLDKQIEATYKVVEEKESLERWFSEAKDLIRNLLRVTYGEGWNYSLDWKVKAEQFLKEE